MLRTIFLEKQFIDIPTNQLFCNLKNNADNLWSRYEENRTDPEVIHDACSAYQHLFDLLANPGAKIELLEDGLNVEMEQWLAYFCFAIFASLVPEEVITLNEKIKIIKTFLATDDNPFPIDQLEFLKVKLSAFEKMSEKRSEALRSRKI